MFERVTLLIVIALFAALPASAETPRVAVSIKPVHSLIAGVMEGVGVPYLIVKGGDSPHTYALKPSDSRQLGQAQLVFWIGPAMEAFLTKPLQALAENARIIELAADIPINVTASGHEHEAEEPDLHLWLDPGKARAMVAVAVAALSAADPPNIFHYRANGLRVSQRLDNLDAEMRLKLDKLTNIPFIVFHNAYSHLAAAYELNVAGVVAFNPEVNPGPRKLAELRHRISRLGVRCIFREPQFDSRLTATLAEGSAVRIGVLDPLGSDMEAGPDLYFKMMSANAESLSECLGPP
ncbi:MAG: hypothetical protein A3G18_02180 [Rhodospirillales bacterium RIFCSPLOWO2_12_FULL_58_28]|nr:MAG: hypothetical protein A3H92_07335 [Rhodospirillales bacterium RIFCSPLOWO2_02_FULL_58_16]OHC79093.1 MAG: hypothetical protein A3G18_02180 [Rhodospirillales bacterium RIFCSPLOWO2_12_FULL_58_28]